MTYAKFKSAQRPLAFGRVPQGVHLGEVGLRRAAALLAEPGFDEAEAADEFLVRRAQSALGIDLKVAGDVGDDEQEIAELLLDRRRGRRPPSERDAIASSSSASSSSSFASTGASEGQSKPTFAALFCNLIARVSAGRPTGTSPSRPAVCVVRRSSPRPWRGPRSPARLRLRAPPPCRTRAGGGGSSWR